MILFGTDFGFDLGFFLTAASAILHGQTPYGIGGFFSPYPLALLLVPLAFLPFWAAYCVWTGLKLFLVARSGNRWQFLNAISFFPVIFDLKQGQLDLLIFAIATRLNWVGAVVSTLRPQLGIWIIPFLAWNWWKDKRYDQFWKSALGVVVLFEVSTLVDPGWWANWFNAPSVAWQYNEQSTSLFGLAKALPFSHLNVFIGVAILAVLSFALLRPQTPRAYWQWVALFNPVAHVYSLVILFNQVDWVVIILGLLALPFSQLFQTNAVWSSVPLYLILKDRLFPILQSQAAFQRMMAHVRSRPLDVPAREII